MPPDSRIPGAGSRPPEPIPYGYAVRYALSRHLGGRKKCAGAPRCAQCARNNAPSSVGPRKVSRATEKAVDALSAAGG
jgi:hypothetical protein